MNVCAPVCHLGFRLGLGRYYTSARLLQVRVTRMCVYTSKFTKLKGKVKALIKVNASVLSLTRSLFMSRSIMFHV